MAQRDKETRRISFLNVSIFLFCIILSSCQKNVTVDIPTATEEIVVEGKIETGAHPIVLLSHTLPFFGEINTSELILNSITGAKVIVTDGTIIDTLIQLPGIGVYVGTQLVGTPGKTYSLTILSGNKTIHSVTTIPQPVKLDSLWWKVDGRRDSLGFSWAHFTDPDSLGNNYQWLAQRINHYKFGLNKGKIKDSTFIAPLGGSVFEDKFVNSKSFNISFPRGSFSFSQKDDDTNDERGFYKRGDTILIKFSSIDKATFEFWRNEETQVRSNGNPFGSPAPIKSNLIGGLGLWAGYAPTYDTIIAR